MGGGGGVSSATAEQRPHLFNKGSQVEVSSDEEGSKGAWYVATILDHPVPSTPRSNSSNKNSKKPSPSPSPSPSPNKVKGVGVYYYVEYQTLLSDEDGCKPLRENVNVAFIRPLPPLVTDSFELNDVVDAFYRDGWWTGFITRVVLENSLFVVTFQNPPNEIEFGVSQLRVHQEWVNGNWVVRPHKQTTTGLMFAMGKKVEVSLISEYYRGVWFPAIVLQDFGNGFFLVEYQSSGIVDKAGIQKITVDYLHIRPSPPRLKDRKFVLFEKVDAFSDFGWWSGVITKELADSRYIVFFKRTNKQKDLNKSELRPHMEWKNGKWFIASKRSAQPKFGEQDNQTTGPEKKSGRPAKSPVKTSLLSADVKEGNDVGKTAEDFSEKECIREEDELPVTGLACNRTKSTRAKKSSQFFSEKSLKEEDQQVNDSATNMIKEAVQLQGGESTQKKRSRGPPKLTKSPKASATDELQNGVVAADKMIAKDCIMDDVDLPTIAEVGSTVSSKEFTKLSGDAEKLMNGPAKQKNQPTSLIKLHFGEKCKVSGEEVLQASSTLCEKHSLMRGRKRSNSLITGSSIQDPRAASGDKTAETDSKMNKVEVGIDNLPSNMADEQFLSKSFGGRMSSPITVDSSSVSSGIIVQQSMEATEIERTNEGITVSSAVNNANSNIGPGGNQSLPFLKNTLLWKTIESMEVFQKIPQKPHFRPLANCKESYREGLALGNMITFSSVVERTSRLRFDDGRSNIEDSLETLGELESHGFEVEGVRDRLTGLLLKKDKQVQLEGQVKEVESRIAEHNVQRSKIVEEIGEIEKQIRELGEKRAVAMSMKETKDCEISYLESRLDEINKGIRSVRGEFEGLAAAPVVRLTDHLRPG